MEKETLTIGNKVYYVRTEDLPQSDLLFYPENPRVYSVLRTKGDEEEPSQEEIEKCMVQMEHVKKLKSAIETNGGLIDPLIVKEDDNVVLEGNSRLAAYRLLNRTNPLKWGKVKCLILPKEVDDSAIFTLLGQYHIVGRKDWSPFEQAGYLYRRLQDTKYPIEKMAEELGITASSARNYIEVYKFMNEHNDLKADRWSYYEEYLKNRSLKALRLNTPELDEKMVELVKSGGVEHAQDMRKLGEIASLNNKVSQEAIEKISKGEVSIHEAHSELNTEKQISDIVKQIEKFRKTLSPREIDGMIISADDDTKERLVFELKHLNLRISKLLDSLDNH